MRFSSIENQPVQGRSEWLLAIAWGYTPARKFKIYAGMSPEVFISVEEKLDLKLGLETTDKWHSRGKPIARNCLKRIFSISVLRRALSRDTFIINCVDSRIVHQSFNRFGACVSFFLAVFS